jgi:hypothetical protein
MARKTQVCYHFISVVIADGKPTPRVTAVTVIIAECSTIRVAVLSNSVAGAFDILRIEHEAGVLPSIDNEEHVVETSSYEDI